MAVRSDPSGAEAAAGERYLLLADISGYTRFMSGVEVEHGVDFSDGIPAAYSVLGDLLYAVVEGIKPDLALVKFEGDAVFAAAPAAALDGKAIGSSSDPRDVPGVHRRPDTGDPLERPRLHRVSRRRAPRLEGGPPSRTGRPSAGRIGSDLLGPAVTIAHRLLKNAVRDRIGARLYLFMTEAAATGLGLEGIGLAHGEAYRTPGRSRVASSSSAARLPSLGTKGRTALARH